eukprot:TRINITY_DN6840_c0_g1_i1.p1 TRINITY_DN6840_c0_g1~~TRINITY_DN6840_c0_g1_i1.p1  ORF type:complete len:85 (-),score=3.12 TRINITY_DN6840_c0_g1_i1:148-369(-)
MPHEKEEKLQSILSEIKANFLLMGIIPFVLNLSEPEFSWSVVLEALHMCRWLCREMTREFMACGALKSISGSL